MLYVISGVLFAVPLSRRSWEREVAALTGPKSAAGPRTHDDDA
jgi:hypothetical protein